VVALSPRTRDLYIFILVLIFICYRTFLYSAPLHSLFCSVYRPTAVRLSCFSHIVLEQLRLLPLTALIQLNMSALISRSYFVLALEIIGGLTCLPTSASSHRSLRSLNRFDLLVPGATTKITKLTSNFCLH